MTNVETFHQSPSERCPYCGALVSNGYDGCQSLMHEVTALAFSDAGYFAVHRAVVDCYTLQHPEFYCVSAKSYAAHLAGLCCKIEHQSSNAIYTALNRWLDGMIELQKPKLLSFRGTLIVTHVQEATYVEDYVKKVDEWSNSVWNAYSELHATARLFVKLALAAKHS